MMSILDPVGRAQRQHAADMSRVEGLNRERDFLIKQRPAADEFEGLVTHEERLTALDRKLAIAAGVAKHSASLLASAQADAAKRAGEAEHAAEEKRVVADMKLIREADALAAKLAAKLAEIEGSRTRTAAVNEGRGTRGFILDAETRVRQRPASVEPAIVEERQVWRSANGDTPTFYSKSESGELVPAGGNAGAFRLVREAVVVREKRVIPARTPERFAEAFRLTDLAGEQIWPR